MSARICSNVKHTTDVHTDSYHAVRNVALFPVTSEGEGDGSLSWPKLCANYCIAISDVALACLQGAQSLMQILQSIQVNRVHTVHEALALLDTLGSSMQVRQVHCGLVLSHVLQI